MRAQIQEAILLIASIITAAIAISYVYPQITLGSTEAGSVAKIASESVTPKAEIVSYYYNGTHVIFYVKVYDDVNASNLIFYINGRIANFYPNRGIIKKGSTITVFSEAGNDYEYNLLGATLRGVYIVRYKTVLPAASIKKKVCPWYFSLWTCRMPIHISPSSTPVKDFILNLSIDTASLISSGKLRSDCGDLRFTAVYPYEGTNYTEGLILDVHFDNDVKDYSGLNNDGVLTSGKFVDFMFNKGLENGTVTFPPLNVSQFTITTWIKVYNNSWQAPEDWWNTDWKYRISVNISNGNVDDLYNFPAKIVLDTQGLYAQGKVKSDLSDIRVVQKLPAYKIEVYNPNTYTLNNYQIKTSVLDRNGKAMYFDGDNDYIEVPDSSSLDITDYITICAWIKTNASSDQMIVGKNDAYLFAVASGGVLYFNYYSGTDWAGHSYSNSIVNDGKFHHVCVTYNSTSGEVKFYIDGRLDSVTTVPNQQIYQSSYNLRIGDMKWWNWFFNGTIDEVRVYNDVLDTNAINSCYRGVCPTNNLVLYFSFDDGTAKDLSGNGNDGTVYNAQPVEPGIKGLLWNGNFSIYNPSTKKYLNYCFEQPNGECNEIYSNYIWVKIDYLPSNSNITLYILPEEKNNATNGFNVFDFYDDFNDGDLSSWTEVGVSNCWEEMNGALHGKYLGSSISTECRIKRDFSDTANFIYEWRAKYVTTTSNGYPWAGIEIKSAYIDKDNYDYGYLILPYTNTGTTNANNVIKIFRSAGSLTLLNSFSYTIQDGKFYIWRVVYDNGNISIYDVTTDSPMYIGSAQDNSYSSGNVIRLFFETNYGDAYFDWIRIRKYADQEPIVENITLGYAQIEIPFIFETSTGFNTTDSPSTNTTIWFKAKYLPASTNTTVYVYYGNPDADPTVYIPKDIFLIYEDFDTTPNGTLVGDAYYDSNNKYVVLTQNTNGQMGYLVYNITPRYGFYAKFYFKTGLGNGADAVWLGAYDSDYAGTTEDIVNGGYHFTFDEYQDRICFTKSTTDNGDGIICQTGITNIDNWQWHEAEIYFWYNPTNACTKIYYDNVLVVEGCDSTIQANVLNKAGLIVFGGRTGGLNNYHIVGIKLLLVDYLPNITVSYGQEEGLNPQRRRIIEKPKSFGLEILYDTIYGFVNTTNGYKEISYKLNPNTLYFVSLVYDGTYLKLYVNGAVVNYTSISGTVLSNRFNLIIDFEGIIDELRIYNVSLAQDRILKEYKRDLERELVYYVENCNSTKTKVYVRLPFLANETIYMYYCNPNADSVSTFEALKLVDEDFNNLRSWHIFRYSNDPNNECYLNNGLLYLTTATNNKGCMMFYKERIIPFYVKFRYLIGGGGGSGADGMAFAFDKDIEPYKTYGRSSAGGSLGLMACDGSSNYISDGYAVEFDNYQNSGDPSANHIALIRTNTNVPYNHLAYYSDGGAYTEDNNWHIAEIWFEQGTDSIKNVTIDGNTIFTNVALTPLGYYWIGFGAGTGGLTNNHVLDWVKVYGLKYTSPWPTYTLGAEETC